MGKALPWQRITIRLWLKVTHPDSGNIIGSWPPSANKKMYVEMYPGLTTVFLSSMPRKHEVCFGRGRIKGASHPLS